MSLIFSPVYRSTLCPEKYYTAHWNFLYLRAFFLNWGAWKGWSLTMKPNVGQMIIRKTYPSLSEWNTDTKIISGDLPFLFRFIRVECRLGYTIMVVSDRWLIVNVLKNTFTVRVSIFLIYIRRWNALVFKNQIIFFVNVNLNFSGVYLWLVSRNGGYKWIFQLALWQGMII